MVLIRPDSWVWDLWIADTGTEYHLFYLTAPRGLVPNDRHRMARVAHAVSTDLRSWTDLGDALTPSEGPAFDDLATWTGSTVRDDDGLWHTFYTGLSRRDDGMVQRIGAATSKDLVTWTKRGPEPLVVADARWYHQWSPGQEPEAWRDPWVVRDPDGDGWHMLITATARHGHPSDRGVLGHAWSPDLAEWQVRPPLTEPDSGFGQLEVPQVCDVEGQQVLLFNCLGRHLSDWRRAEATPGGVWALPVEHLLGPHPVSRATRLTDESLYVAKLLQQRDGQWVILAFVNEDEDGNFIGTVTDPLRVPLPLGSGPVLSSASAGVG